MVPLFYYIFTSFLFSKGSLHSLSLSVPPHQISPLPWASSLLSVYHNANATANLVHTSIHVLSELIKFMSDVSVVKNLLFSQKMGLGHQHPQAISQTFLTLVPGDPVPFSCFVWISGWHAAHISTYSQNNHIHGIKINKSLKHYEYGWKEQGKLMIKCVWLWEIYYSTAWNEYSWLWTIFFLIFAFGVFWSNPYFPFLMCC